MKAMILNGLGECDAFELAEINNPSVTLGHLVVKVCATSVNPLDTMLRSTETPWSENLPKVLHGDVAGIVEKVGADVTRFKVGDKVYGCAGGVAGINGALSEYMLVDADLMAHMPSSLTMRQAAALPLVSITAWEALVLKMKISAGDKVLIHGATGGVGHIAVQLAKALGADVTTTSLVKNLETAKTLGADHVVNAEVTSVADYIAEITDGQGFDAVFDPIAGDHIQKSFEAVRFNGAVATTLPITDVLQVALKGLSFHSILMLIPMVTGKNRRAHGEILEQIAKLVDDGKITPLLDDSEFSVADVSKAHAKLQSGTAVGKIVMTGFNAEI
ncbi:zinc-dependent alcohol dehydrogenase family protein [Pseudovibrio sp. Tun.PSC04-5.I4]|uniref:zinc-dependent alcohol dehydrogenase family protein n=1 Tax=Pseudovibrio sp. Tun.PSC04-5.I4 TaxID=1798213 RepID=UPI000886E1C3|nr:zinc-dependent alcohol dehydrogenase family protein [Pseudovibrio sp. Tun.PSC04-5.I4]SDR22282.1 NADPH2:quinone reductase [Pseudovibrio sp. Tun.PSC04-5.I4]